MPDQLDQVFDPPGDAFTDSRGRTITVPSVAQYIGPYEIEEIDGTYGHYGLLLRRIGTNTRISIPDNDVMRVAADYVYGRGDAKIAIGNKLLAMVKRGSTMKTPKNLEFIRERAAAGATQVEISKAIGVTRQRVSQICAKHGIKANGYHRTAVSLEALDIYGLINAGMTRRQVAQKLGLTYGNLTSLVARQGIKWPTAVERDTAAKIKRVRELAAQGYSKSEVAMMIWNTQTPLYNLLNKHGLHDIKWRDGRKPYEHE